MQRVLLHFVTHTCLIYILTLLHNCLTECLTLNMNMSASLCYTTVSLWTWVSHFVTKVSHFQMCERRHATHDLLHLSMTSRFVCMCVSYSYVCHDSFTCVSWLVHMCVMTHSHVWKFHATRSVWVVCRTCRISMRHVSTLYVRTEILDTLCVSACDT